MKSRAHVGVLVDDDRPPTPLVWAVSSVEGSRHIWVSNVPRGLVIVRYPYFVLPIGCILYGKHVARLQIPKGRMPPWSIKACLGWQVCFVWMHNCVAQQVRPIKPVLLFTTKMWHFSSCSDTVSEPPPFLVPWPALPLLPWPSSLPLCSAHLAEYFQGMLAPPCL